MKNKNIVLIAFLTLLVGILIGWLIFGRTTAEMDNHLHMGAEDEKQTWTCSMHPQIHLNESGDCPICGMELIPLASSNGGNSYTLEMSEEAVAMSNIQTTIVGQSSSNGTPILLNGILKADETMIASLVTHIPGRIEQLFVSFTGEKVIKGQKIAMMYSPDLITAQKELIEAKKLNELSPSLLESAKNKLRYWKISNQVIDQILKTEKIQEQFAIYAEHTGIVKTKKITVGDYVSTGEVLFTIENLSQLWVVLDVYEKDLSDVSIGDKVSFSTIAYPNKVFESKIVFIDPNINSATRVANIRAEINNTNKLLKPEMFVKASLNSGRHNNENISIPKTAVLWTGTRSVVYVKQPNTSIPSFEYREVVLGDMIGNNYEIVEGIRSGDELVVNGAFVIDASAQLNNQASMMNKKVSVEKLNSDVSKDFKINTPKAFKIQVESALNEYFTLKNALVQSDEKASQSQANKLLISLSNIDMNLVSGAAHLYWMEQLQKIKSASIELAQSKNLEDQRIHFENISSAFLNTVQAFGVQNIELYVLHCPMANNQGADWLSREAKVLNPYFGDKMLKCGSVMDTINYVPLN
jgi:Cu(I)/Ag(I) efflux system membrane fusion protein